MLLYLHLLLGVLFLLLPRFVSLILNDQNTPGDGNPDTRHSHEAHSASVWPKFAFLAQLESTEIS